MIIPGLALVAGNYLVWNKIRKQNKVIQARRKLEQELEEEKRFIQQHRDYVVEMYDPDEDALYDGRPVKPTPRNFKTCPGGGCEVPIKEWSLNMRCQACDALDEYLDDLATKEHMEKLAWLEVQHIEELSLSLDQIKENFVNCNGTWVSPDAKGIRKFMLIKNKAYLEDEYAGLPLNQGGLERLHYDWFLLLGYPEYMAEQLVLEGADPSKVKRHKV